MDQTKDYYTLVKVNMTYDTLSKISEVQNRIRAPNPTIAIQSAIDIAEIITKIISKGEKIILQKPDGTKSLLTLLGVG